MNLLTNIRHNVSLSPERWALIDAEKRYLNRSEFIGRLIDQTLGTEQGTREERSVCQDRIDYLDKKIKRFEKNKSMNISTIPLKLKQSLTEFAKVISRAPATIEVRTQILNNKNKTNYSSEQLLKLVKQCCSNENTEIEKTRP